MVRIGLALAWIGLLAPAGRAGEEDFVPFVIPLEMSPESEIRLPASEPIPPDGERIAVRDGRFHRGGERVRIWGVNLCFGANFPSHADAEKVAARLAAFGINSVRFHHMDSSGFPRGIWDPDDPAKLSDEALDRLDYFIDQLARRGICANLNLHVSRTHSEVLKLPDPGTKYDKMVGLFTPELIAAQKKYARELLSHVNKYRKVRYADDPAVAFVEISNEDSFFMWGAEERLRSLPDYYADALHAKWHDWLRARYGTNAAMAKAWSVGARPLGENALADVRVARTDDRPGWWLGAHHGCEAEAEETADGVRIRVDKADETGWHVQFLHGGLELTRGRYYTLIFEARAERPREIGYDVGQDHEPWGNLGLRRTAKLSKEWRTFRAGFTAGGSEEDARVCFQLGGDDADVRIRDARLMPGGRFGLAEGESLGEGNVALFAEGETPARAADRMVLRAETEKGFYDGMRSFLQDDLGCGALVTGTILFGPLGLWAQSDMDWIDAHAYWQHPRFPGRPWDPGNWLVDRKAMVDHPAESPLFRLACSRLAGKPFTVSEYNHPSPNDYQAECVPMIASYAAIQDWDGVWLFAYSHRADQWDREHFSSFFDIQANPAKWGFVPAGTMIFREGEWEAPELRPALVEAGVPAERLPAALARLHATHGRDLYAAVQDSLLYGVEWETFLTHRARVSLVRGDRPPPERVEPPDVAWRAGESSQYFAAGNTAVVRVRRHERASPGFYAGALCTLDGKSIAESKRILITVCGRCENTDMRFSEDRRTVGREWGEAPVRVEVRGAGTWRFPEGAAGWRCFALRPDGSRGAEVELQRARHHVEPGLLLTPSTEEQRSMWYLLVRE